MELHERMKRQALAEFESYRQRVEDMQLCTEAQVHAGGVERCQNHTSTLSPNQNTTQKQEEAGRR